SFGPALLHGRRNGQAAVEPALPALARKDGFQDRIGAIPDHVEAVAADDAQRIALLTVLEGRDAIIGVGLEKSGPAMHILTIERREIIAVEAIDREPDSHIVLRRHHSHSKALS